jgi:hypothetical protein
MRRPQNFNVARDLVDVNPIATERLGAFLVLASELTDILFR